MKKNEFNHVRMGKNYSSLLSFLTRREDISEYIFWGIDNCLDNYIKLLSDEEQKIIRIGFGLDDKIIKSYDIIAKKMSSFDKKYNSIDIQEKLELARKRILLISSLGTNFNNFGNNPSNLFIYDEKRIKEELPSSLYWSRITDKNSKLKRKSFITETYEMAYDKLIDSKDIEPEKPTIVRAFRK